MKTAVQIFLRQTVRGKKRLVLNAVLLLAATGFFVVGLNLYHNSRQNLRTVENAYTTIATMEIYGDVDARGNLVHPGDTSCVGRHLLSVEGYDLSPLLALEAVKGIEVRTRVGAYIPGHIQVYHTSEAVNAMPDGTVRFYYTDNVIRFTLNAKEPITVSLQENNSQQLDFPIRILQASNSLLQYPEMITLSVPRLWNTQKADYQEDIRRLNRSDVADSITLYPDVEYVMAAQGGSYWEKDAASGTYIWKADMSISYSGIGLSFNEFLAYTETSLSYNQRGLSRNRSESLRQVPFPLQRYEDVQNDPLWTECVTASEYTCHSFGVVLTEDISMIPAWYNDGMYLNAGRMITDQEYQSGAKVCMVSARLAAQQGWQVGDKLDMHLYTYDGFFDTTATDGITKLPPALIPQYQQSCGGFFEEDTYEIVGIYSQKDVVDTGKTAPEVYYNPWNAIYIPAKAAPNAPEGPIQPSLITIELKNGSINAFKAAVEEMGLTDQVPGEYEIKFSYFDQGYDKIAGGLDEMNRNAKLLLGLSAALLAVTMILTAFLFSRQHKHSAGILRMLGGSKGQAFAAILTCAAAVVAAGGIVGTVLGGALTQSVGASILGDGASAAKVALSTGASPALTALSGLGCMVLFLALTAIFTATYIGKEPRHLLPEDKG